VTDRGVAPELLLDVYDVGTDIRENVRCERCCDEMADLDDLQIGE
jgi:hypothetical protein